MTQRVQVTQLFFFIKNQQLQIGPCYRNDILPPKQSELSGRSGRHSAAFLLPTLVNPSQNMAWKAHVTFYSKLENIANSHWFVY